MPPRPQRPETYASLPGSVDVQWLVWARCLPGKAALPAAAIRLILLLLACILIFAGIKRQFRSGCVDPARTVGQDVIAGYTDLASGSDESGPWPVIKIVRRPLHRAPGAPLRVGDTVAAVALPRGSLKKTHWDDFFPLPSIVSPPMTSPGSA